MGRVLSGIQPTGNIHLGNYLGAIKNWVALQDQHECLFCIVDLHALTVPPAAADLKAWTLELAATYLAAGITQPIFPQSALMAHGHLSWIFSCLTPLGWLNRMTQFKEKAGKSKEQAGLGLYAYPVLMAADILIYQATHVPVGADQKQHLELARDIAGAFNRQVGKDYFTLPEPLIMGHAARVMSLRDGLSKMSKSDVSDYSRINLKDDPDLIAQKIRKAKTDMEFLGVTPSSMEHRPEALNLLSIFAALSDKSLEEVCLLFEGKSFSVLKGQLTDLLIETLSPLQERYHQLMADPEELRRLLNQGAEKAQDIAHKTLKDVHDLLGLYSIRMS